MTVKEIKRLIADEGKVLTNGEVTGYCIDVSAEDADKWSEVEDTAESKPDTETKE